MSGAPCSRTTSERARSGKASAPRHVPSWLAVAVGAGLLAGCGAGSKRPLDPADVSPALSVRSENPFAASRITWVRTGVERYDRFFREAAALQGALVIGQRAAEGEEDPAIALELLRSVAERADAALREGEALLPAARADFAADEKKAWAIGPALHEALGQVRDAAARAPAVKERIRGHCARLEPAERPAACEG